MTTPTIASGTGAWTPGPWMIFDDADRFEIAVGLLGENRICEPLGDTPEQAEANGYLIAAAPELVQAGDELADKLWILRCESCDEKSREAAEAALAMWNAVRRKAEGRNP